MVNVNEAIENAETFARKVIDKPLTNLAVKEVSHEQQNTYNSFSD